MLPVVSVSQGIPPSMAAIWLPPALMRKSGPGSSVSITKVCSTKWPWASVARIVIVPAATALGKVSERMLPTRVAPKAGFDTFSTVYVRLPTPPSSSK